MTLEDNMTLLSWGDTGARGQTGRAGGEPDQQRTESEQRQPCQKGPRDTQTGVGHPTDTEEQQPTQDRRLRAAPSHGNLTGRADQTRSAAPAGLAGRLYQQQPQRNHAQRREQQNTQKLHGRRPCVLLWSMWTIRVHMGGGPAFLHVGGQPPRKRPSDNRAVESY